VRIDAERRLEGLQRAPLVVEAEINLTEAGESAEMARLQSQGTLDVGDARRVVIQKKVDRRALVPAFGETGRALDDGIEGGERPVQLPPPHMRDPTEQEKADIVVVGREPPLPDQAFERTRLALALRRLEAGEEPVERRVGLIGRRAAGKAEGEPDESREEPHRRDDARLPEPRQAVLRAKPMDLSIVIPVRNEAGNIAPLVAEIREALDRESLRYEIVYVDDGSTDGTADELRRLLAAGTPLRVVRHKRSFGQSAAIRTGIKAARGVWIATLDGDGQNDPADIPRLLAIARSEEAPALVAGWRQKRRDTRLKRLSSKIANAVRARLLGDATPDTGCGLKVFRRALFLELPYFDHMHRFLPALVKRAGGRTLSVPVNHRPRGSGRSNYGTLDRLLVGITDLLGVMWLMRRGSVPEVVDE